MKNLKTIANIAILSPLALIVFLGIALGSTLLFRDGMTDEDMWRTSFAIAIPTGFIMFGVAILFPAGVALQAIIAAKTNKPSPWAWWTILIFSALMVIQYGWGIRISGICIILLLLTLKPFRILRRGAEHKPIDNEHV
jgi:hypothetical protein